jgi:hypothetical protein
LASLTYQDRKVFYGVEIEPEYQLHSVTKRLQDGVFVRGREQHAEIVEGNALRSASAFATLKENAPAIQRQIEAGLVELVKLVGFINVDDVAILGTQQQRIEVARCPDRLPEHFMKLAGHLLSDDVG